MWVPLTVDEELLLVEELLDELLVPPVFPPCWFKKLLLLCEDEFVEFDELDDFDEFVEEDPDEL